MTEFKYRKSSYSDDAAECVEVATNIPTTIAIRDSKQIDGPNISIRAATWMVFQAAISNDCL
ncbi:MULTISPECIES: DUF397 domain-containing protein [unclassified Streptomyces]|uniref:DUF397 domain-containing protein n=1 Tax=unclassified Streptomyces TaxID=2593676 RepID=UPI0023661637|nr:MULTISPECIES: DUF397 domain-containing protein [unclassified Streptomyces]MDF3141832.1 DUF397 domain-containing protein [Streptomyces sp. T21Q-yed]WDF41380.1 DUF397 domain-containing protein [Streptomyces sp. T12]